MKAVSLKFSAPVCLVGGGALTREMLDAALAIAPTLVAADGAADRLGDWDLKPDAIIGDMDSISDPDHWRAAGCAVVELDEQDSTDFGKCLCATEAPFYIAVGFTGKRVDHMLAVFSSMLAMPEKTVVLVGEEEVAALIPAARPLALSLAAGAVVSIYPLAPVRGTISNGLQWPIDGLAMQAGGQIGTSNVAIRDKVSIGFDRPGALLMLERRFLSPLIAALT